MKFDTINDIIEYSQFFNDKDVDVIKNNGVVFTDINTCNNIINKLSPKITDKICEPSVGRGAFVFSLLEYFRSEYSIDDIVYFVGNNLFCFDINSTFINELKLMLREYLTLLGYTGELNLANILATDFLTHVGLYRYDIIIGNPPYIRIQNLNKEYLSKLKVNLYSIKLGNVDLYYAFIEKSLIMSDKIGFIVPNSFIKTKSGHFLRHILKDKINYIYDFGIDKVWSKIATYTCIFICNEKSDYLVYETKNEKITKHKSSLSDNKWTFTDLENGNTKLSSLLNYYSGGLATLKDNIFKFEYNDDEYCYKENVKV